MKPENVTTNAKVWLRFKEVVGPVMLVLCNLLVFTPFYIYRGNFTEFRLAFTDIQAVLLIPFITGFVLLTLLGTALKDQSRHRYISAILAVGVMLWLEANLLVRDYGLFNGRNIAWNWKFWPDGADALAWIAVIGWALLFSHKIKSLAASLSSALITLQVLLIGWYSYSNPALVMTNQQDIVPPAGIFEFSSSRNIIHVILDSFQAEMFEKILKKDPDRYSKALDGFTYFNNVVGSFPTTCMSVPAILSGENYQNSVPMRQHITSCFEGRNVPNVLHNMGYQVDFVPLGPYQPRNCDNYYTIPLHYGKGFTESYYRTYLAAEFLDLSLFRSMPHLLKRYIFNDQKWLFSRLVSKDESPPFQSISDKNFLSDVINQSRVTVKKPVYKFTHLAITHQPIVMDEKGVYAGGVLPATPDNFAKQDQFGLDDFIRLIQRLKELGVYDNSLIILQADHGSGIPVGDTQEGGASDNSLYNVIGSASPLLLIKPPHMKGPLRISSNAISLTDVPTTIMEVAGIKSEFPGLSAFTAADPMRQRKFYHYRWVNDNWQADYFKSLEEYTVTGNVSDAHSWRLTGFITRTPEVYQTTAVHFGTPGAEAFVGSGWGGDESSAGRPFRWALGEKASLLLALPKDKPVMLTAEVKVPTFKSPQIIDAEVDGKRVAVWRVSDNGQWQTVAAVLAPSADRRDVSVIDFHFSQSCPPTKQDPRRLSVMFSSVNLKRLDVCQVAFGTSDALPFLRQGWSPNEPLQADGIPFNWALGKAASIAMPLPAKKSVVLTARVKFLREPRPQQVSVHVNGRKLGVWNVSNSGEWEDHSITVPADALKTGMNIVEFRFQRAIKVKNDPRTLALLFNSIQFH